MADIKLVADVSSIRDAQKALERFANASDKMGRSVVGAAKKVQSVSSGWAEANTLYKQGIINSRQLGQAQVELARELATLNNYTKANGALNTDRALRELRAAEAARRNAQATQEAAQAQARAKQSYNQLLASINPTIAAQQRMKRAHDTVREALRQGIITREQAAQSLREYRAAAQAAGNRTQQTARRTNQLGVLMQQTGYQVGDFAVQIQSGTNVMVALGQQATQLIGTFGMLARSTRMIAVFAGLGIAVPIATAIAGAFIRSAESAKDLETEVDSLDQTLRKYAKTQEAVSKGLSFEELIAEDALEKAKKDLQDIEDAFSGFKTGKISSRAYLTALIPFADALGLGPLDQIKNAEDAVAAAIERVSELQDMVNEKNQKSLQESLRLRNQELELLRVEKQFGQDSVQYVEAKNQQEVKNLRLKLEQKAAVGGITAEERTLIEEIMAAKLQQQATRKELELSKGEAKGLAEALREAASAMSSLQSFGQGLERALEVARAKAVAIKNATSEAVAGQITGMRFDLEAKRQEAVAAGVDPVIAGAEAAISSATIDQLEKQRKENEAAREASRSSGGGGGGGGSAINERQKMIDSVNRLISSYDEEYAKALKVEEATRLIAKAQRMGAIPANMEADQVLQDYIKSLEDAKDPMADFVNNFAKQMSSAFMSIVDGSKSASDAFRDMARAILKQAFEMAVINPIINSIFGGVGGFTKLPSFFANGAAFNNGKVTAFADGGVVNQPTMFPMANGAGLMGEAGPEAVMPLKRGKNGKLGVQVEGGSQQPIVINQSFNFAANGDESVKRIIAQEAPKIANLTQKQILDQRRRGGVMKSTFG